MARIVEMIGSGTAGNTTAIAFGEPVITVPSDQFWIPRSVWLAWTSCAAVGNRLPSVFFRAPDTNLYGQVQWLPVQAASLTHYYSAWEGATSSTAVAATSYAQASLPRDLVLTAGFTITPVDGAGITGGARYSFAVATIDSVTATTVVATSAIFGGADTFKGSTLTMGSSTAVITTNDDTTLTFAAWVGGTPTPADYYLEADIAALTMAYDAYAEMIV